LTAPHHTSGGVKRALAVLTVGAYVALLVPYWLGALDGSGLMMLGHILMFRAMLGAMLLRRGRYYH
jgi:hypothetical protein